MQSEIEDHYNRCFLRKLQYLLLILIGTALSCACIDLLEPRSMIMTLVNGGAHIDFRTRNGGFTSLHKSAIHYRKESIVVCLKN